MVSTDRGNEVLVAAGSGARTSTLTVSYS